MEKKSIKVDYQKSDNYKEAFSNIVQYGISPYGQFIDIFFDEDTVMPFKSEAIRIDENGEIDPSHTFVSDADFVRVRHARIKMPLDAVEAMVEALNKLCKKMRVPDGVEIEQKAE